MSMDALWRQSPQSVNYSRWQKPPRENLNSAFVCVCVCVCVCVRGGEVIGSCDWRLCAVWMAAREELLRASRASPMPRPRTALYVRHTASKAAHRWPPSRGRARSRTIGVNLSGLGKGKNANYDEMSPNGRATQQRKQGE
jgi:hypothetical protein